MAWLWNDTLADLLETIDRVEPEALSVLRSTTMAYRLADDGNPITLARSVFEDLRGAATGPVGPSDPIPSAPGPRPSSRLV